MVGPLTHRQQLFTAALKEYPVVGVRAFVTWHLGRPPTVSESSSTWKSANVLEAADGCQLQRVSQSQPVSGRNLVVMIRPDLSLADWPKRAVILAAAREFPPDVHGTRDAIDRMIAALNEAARTFDRIPLTALTPEQAAAAADALGKPLAKLGRVRRHLVRRGR